MGAVANVVGKGTLSADVSVRPEPAKSIGSVADRRCIVIMCGAVVYRPDRRELWDAAVTALIAALLNGVVAKECFSRAAHWSETRSMPTLSAFYGIVIQMFWQDHPPPHFHALYAEYAALTDIQTLDVIVAPCLGVRLLLCLSGRRHIVPN